MLNVKMLVTNQHHNALADAYAEKGRLEQERE